MDVSVQATTFGPRRDAWRTTFHWRAVMLTAFVTLLMSAPGEASEAQCLERTAKRYALPATLLRAIRDVEGGREGIWRRNTNHTYDYGVMQINSVWLPRLKPLGYDAYVLTHDQCASIAVAGWILAQAFAEAGDGVASDAQRYWQAVGRYHSATASLNRRYAERVWRRMGLDATSPSRPIDGDRHGR